MLSTIISPESAGKSPVIMSASVLLPAPDNPIIPIKTHL